MRTPPAALMLVVLVACSSSPRGTLRLVTGGESDTFSRAPAPTTLEVASVDSTGAVTTLARAALTSARVALPAVAEDGVGAFLVTAFDDAGIARVRGASLPLRFGLLDGRELPIFVQRTGEFARMSAPLGAGLAGPMLALLEERYVLAVQGTATQLYDLLSLEALPSPPLLPRAAGSLAVVGSEALLVDDAGATWFDFASSRSRTASEPPGGRFGEVAGGQSVRGGDGASYIVGATRISGAPSARILRVGVDGALTFASLQAARRGAGAAWMGPLGLVVVGGTAAGAGVELLGPTATQAVSLAFAPDDREGHACAALDDGHVLDVVGGVPLQQPGAAWNAALLDLACSAGCRPTPWPSPQAAPLRPLQALALDAGSALLLVSDAAGESRTYRASAMEAHEIPLKIGRRDARAAALPTGNIAIVGGSPVIESFTP